MLESTPLVVVQFVSLAKSFCNRIADKNSEDDDYESTVSITSKDNKRINLPPLPNHVYTCPMEVDEGEQPLVLEQCGPVGLSRDQLSKTMEVDTLLRSASAFVAGYDIDKLVKSKFGENWCVKIDDKFIYPRQWVNLEGDAVEGTWRNILFAIISILMIYPGISLVSILNMF